MSPLSGTVWQLHRQHQVPGRQPGEHHRQGAVRFHQEPLAGRVGAGIVVGCARIDDPPGRGVAGAGYRRRQHRMPIGVQVPVQTADQPVRLPSRRGFGVRACPAGNTREVPPRADSRRSVPTTDSGERVGRRSPTPRRPRVNRSPWSDDPPSSRWPRYAPWPQPPCLCVSIPADPAAPSDHACARDAPPSTRDSDRRRRAAEHAATGKPLPSAAPAAGASGRRTHRAPGGSPTPVPHI